jgi:hypothetical protein
MSGKVNGGSSAGFSKESAGSADCDNI